MKNVGNADVGARVTWGLPLWNGRRLPQVVYALLDQNPQQGGREALAHRPTFERRESGQPLTVSLGNESASPCHHKRGSHPFSRLEGCVNNLLELRCVDLGRQRLFRQHITHWPLLCRWVRQSALDRYRSEINGTLANRERHASLAPEIFGAACDTIRERDVNCSVGAIDHWLPNLAAFRVRAREISNVLSCEVRREAGNEHCRTHDLRKAGRVVL